MPTDSGLPPGVRVLERGWLSANNVLFTGPGTTGLIDSGYCTHAGQTLQLVAAALGGRPPDLLLNTHLHSDHCGGNAALQSRYPELQTCIPPGQAPYVAQWDPVALTYEPTGQECPRFTYSRVLQPGACIELGHREWQIHGAAGHDPHSVILFEPESRTLVSADALWENGFGVVFPELEGVNAFDEVAQTLDLIESLRPVTVIPGHGRVFTSVSAAIHTARKRLQRFQADPRAHALHAAKVLLKFKLLEWQQTDLASIQLWAARTAYFGLLLEQYFNDRALDDWTADLIADLVRSGAARIDGTAILNH